MKNSFLFICLVYCCSSFSQDFDIYGESEANVLSANQVRKKIETHSEDDGIIIYTYDKNGRLLTIEDCGEDVEVISTGWSDGNAPVYGDTTIQVYIKTTLHYKGDKVMYETSINPYADKADTLTNTDTTAHYFYNENGWLEKTVRWDHTAKYTYDEKGNMMRVEITFIKDTTNSIYAENNEYNSKNERVHTYTDDPGFPFEINYYYNRKGNLIKETRGFKGEDHNIVIEYVYNKKGLLIERRLLRDLEYYESHQSQFFSYEYY